MKSKVFINIVSKLQNHIIEISEKFDEERLKNLIFYTLSNDMLDGKMFKVVASETKIPLIFKDYILNICMGGNNTIGELVIDLQDSKFGNSYSLPHDYIKQQIDKYWNDIMYYINYIRYKKFKNVV